MQRPTEIGVGMDTWTTSCRLDVIRRMNHNISTTHFVKRSISWSIYGYIDSRLIWWDWGDLVSLNTVGFILKQKLFLSQFKNMNLIFISKLRQTSFNLYVCFQLIISTLGLVLCLGKFKALCLELMNHFILKWSTMLLFWFRPDVPIVYDLSMVAAHCFSCWFCWLLHITLWQVYQQDLSSIICLHLLGIV